jgi:hypothetical protein
VTDHYHIIALRRGIAEKAVVDHWNSTSPHHENDALKVQLNTPPTCFVTVVHHYMVDCTECKTRATGCPVDGENRYIRFRSSGPAVLDLGAGAVD